MSKVLNRPRASPLSPILCHGIQYGQFHLRDALQESPGLAATIAGAVWTDKDGTTLLAVPRAMPVLVAVAGDDAVHTWWSFDGDRTATGVAVAGTVWHRRGQTALGVLSGRHLLVQRPPVLAADEQ